MAFLPLASGRSRCDSPRRFSSFCGVHHFLTEGRGCSPDQRDVIAELHCETASGLGAGGWHLHWARPAERVLDAESESQSASSRLNTSSQTCKQVLTSACPARPDRPEETCSD